MLSLGRGDGAAVLTGVECSQLEERGLSSNVRLSFSIPQWRFRGFCCFEKAVSGEESGTMRVEEWESESE
jgi:hypothetical protein